MSSTAFDDQFLPHPEDDAGVAARGVEVELPHPLGIVDPEPTAPPVYSVQDLINYARAAVLADRERRRDELTIAYMAGAQAGKDRQQRDRESLQAVAKQMYLALCEENAAYDEPIHHVAEAIRVYEDHSSAALSAQEQK